MSTSRENIQGPFQQVLSRQASLELVPIYYIVVAPEQVQQVCATIKKHVSEGSEMGHLRRVVKIEGAQPLRLKVMIAQVSEISKDTAEALFPDYDVLTSQAASTRPDTKEQCIEWNKESWPILWRGNVAAALPTLSETQRDQMISWCTRVQQAARGEHQPKKLKTEPSCCESSLAVFVDPLTNTIKGESGPVDNPLGHAVIAAIESVAQTERDSRSSGEDAGYLCSGLDLYVYFEPCTMCTMGALHSRINRLIYLRPRDSGAISGYKMHDRAQLNHTFEVWQFLG